MAAKKSAAGSSISLRGLNRATLARQMLLTKEKVAPLRAIERLLGLQAQLPRPPFLGLWSRIAGFERRDLTRLLTRREVVRGTLMRGTLHLTSARDYVSFRPVLQPVPRRWIWRSDRAPSKVTKPASYGSH